jgi:FAD/FMN-containing dehydrogenase
MTSTLTLDDLVACPVFRPADPGYDDEVTGFNLAVPHRPELVVGATSTDDVAAAIRWAAGEGLPIAVQATGHGSAPIDGGLLISTRRMNRVEIDPVARTATAEPGARWRDVLAAAAPHGLGGLGGSSTDVGVVGFTVGGGLPVLGRAFGWAADRVQRMQVVTADGAVHDVDAEHEPELFWALRGGKGNAGIVTSLTFGLLPLRRFYGGTLHFPGESAPAVLRAYARWSAALPELMASALLLLRVPPFPDVPEPIRGRFVVQLSVAYPGAAEEGERLLAPMRAVAPVLLDGLGDRPYTEVDRVFLDPQHPVPAEESGLLLRELPPAALDAILDLAGPGASTPLLFVGLRQLGGALSRPPAVPDAVCGRDAAFLLQTVGILAGPHAAEVPAATAAVQRALAPWSTGRTFVNLHGTPGDEADRARAWTPEVYDRLRRVKGRWDPGNLLRFGHAVPPGG